LLFQLSVLVNKEEARDDSERRSTVLLVFQTRIEPKRELKAFCWSVGEQGGVRTSASQSFIPRKQLKDLSIELAELIGELIVLP
ncbi:unnamed protein product, partial [Brassica napus]